jgi:hypothetical protein
VKTITVKDLRDMLDGIEDEDVVLLESTDHSFRRPVFTYATALFHPRHGWFEDFGPEYAGHTSFTQRRDALIIR